MAARIIAASLLAAPADFAQNSMGATPSHMTAKTTTTDTMTADTDKAGKTVVKHHKVAKHSKKATKTDDAANNTAQ